MALEEDVVERNVLDSNGFGFIARGQVLAEPARLHLVRFLLEDEGPRRGQLLDEIIVAQTAPEPETEGLPTDRRTGFKLIQHLQRIRRPRKRRQRRIAHGYLNGL